VLKGLYSCVSDPLQLAIKRKIKVPWRPSFVLPSLEIVLRIFWENVVLTISFIQAQEQLEKTCLKAIIGDQDMKNPLQLTASSFSCSFDIQRKSIDPRTFSKCSLSLSSLLNLNEMSFFDKYICIYPLQPTYFGTKQHKDKASAINRSIWVTTKDKSFHSNFLTTCLYSTSNS
jgi:hypothetical protein